MSAVIDERVVKMEFDSDNFEKNVASSLKAIQNLNNTLNNLRPVELFDGIGKSTKLMESGFDKVSSSLDTLTHKFSFVDTFTRGIVNNLSNSFYGVITKGIKTIMSVPNIISQGGWNRALTLEKAKFTMDGILNDATKVALVMKEVDYGVSGTAYGLDEAAAAAAQLVSSGVSINRNLAGNKWIDSMSRMDIALRGISGVAANTGASYAEIADIFSTVAGRGRVMGIELNRLSARGFAAAATLTNFFNGVNNGSITATDSVTAAIKSMTNGAQVTEATIRDLISKGKMEFDIFAEAMDSTFGEKAKDANSSFEGAISNIRAALKKIGADFATPIIQNAPNFLNPIRTKINELRATLLGSDGALTTAWTKTVKWVFDTLGQTISSIDFSWLQKVGDELKSNYDLVYMFYLLIKNIITPIRVIGAGLANAFKVNESASEFLINMIKSFNQFLSDIQPTKDFLYILYGISSALGSVIKLIINGLFTLFTSTTGIFAPISKLINFVAKHVSMFVLIAAKLLEMAANNRTLAATIVLVSGALLDLSKATKGTSLIINSLRNSISILKGAGLGLLIALIGTGLVAAIILAVRNFDKLKAIITDVSKYIFGFVKNAITTLANGFTKVMSSISEKIYELTGGIINFTGVGAKLNGFLQRIKTVIVEISKLIGGFISDKIGKVFDITSILGNSIQKQGIFGVVKNLATDFVGVIASTINSIKNSIATNGVFNTIINIILMIGKNIHDIFTKAISSIKTFGRTISTIFSESGFSVDHFIFKLKSIGDVIGKVINLNSFKNIGNEIQNAINQTFKLQKGVSAHELYGDTQEYETPIKDTIKWYEKLFTTLINGFNKVKTFVTNIPKYVKTILDNIITTIKSVFPFFSDIITKVQNFINTLQVNIDLSSIIENFKIAVTTIQTTGKKLLNWIVDLTRGFDPAIVMSMMFVASIIGINVALFRLIEALTLCTGSLTGFMKAVTSLITGSTLNSLIKTKNKILGTTDSFLVSIAFLIMSIAASLAVLAIVAKEYDLAPAAVALGIITVLVTALSLVAAKISTISKVSIARYTVATTGIISLAAAMTLLAISVGIMAKVVDSYGAENMWQALRAVAALVFELSLITALLSIIPKTSKSIGNLFGLILLSTSLLIVVKAIKDLMDSASSIDLKEVIPVIAVLLATMGLLSLMISNMSVFNALAFLIVSADIKMMVPVIIELGHVIEDMLKQVKWSAVYSLVETKGETVKKAIYLFAILAASMLGILIGAAVVMKTLSDCIILIAISVALILSVVKTWNNINWGDVIKNVLFLAVIFTGLAVVLKMVNGLTYDKKQKAKILNLNAFLLMLIILTYTLVALGHIIGIMKLSTYGKMIATYIILFAGLSTIFGMMKKTKDANTDAIKAMNKAILMIMIGLATLSFVKPDRLITSTLAIAGILYMLTKVYKALGTLTSFPQPATGAIIATVSGLAAIILEIGLLSKFIDPDYLVTTVLAIAGLMYAYAYMIRSMKLNDLRPNKHAWVSLLAATVPIILIVGELALLAKMPIDGVLYATIAVAGILGMFILVFKALSKVTKAGQNWKANLSLFGGAAIGLLVVVTGLIVLSNMPWQGILSGMFAMGATLAAYALVLTQLDKFKIGHGSVVNIAFMALFATTLAILIGGLIVLANQPMSGLLASTLTMGATLSAFALVLNVLLNQSKATAKAPTMLATLLSAIGLILSITIPLVFLADKPWEKLLSASVTMGLTLSALALTLKMLSHNANATGNPLTLLALIGGLALVMLSIGGTLVRLSSVGWTKALTATLSLSAVLVVFAFILKTISAITVSGTDLGKKAILISVMAGLMLVIGLIATGMAYFAKDWKTLAASGGVLIGGVLACAALAKAISDANFGSGNIVQKIAMLGVVLGAIVLIGGILIGFAHLGIDKIGPSFLILSGTILMLATATMLLSKVNIQPTQYQSILVALGIYTGLIFSLMAIAEILPKLADGLSNMDNTEWESIGKVAVAILAIDGIIGLMTWLLSKVGNVKWHQYIVPFIMVIGSIAGIAYFLPILAESLDSFDLVEWESIGKVAVAITAIGGIITALTFLTKQFINNGNNITGFASYGEVVLSMIFIMEMLDDLAKGVDSFTIVPWESIGKATVTILGLGAIIEALTIVVSKFLTKGNLLHNFADVLKQWSVTVVILVQLAVLIPIIKGLAWAITGLKGIVIEDIVNAFVMIGALGGAMIGLTWGTKKALPSAKDLAYLGATLLGAVSLAIISSILVSAIQQIKELELTDTDIIKLGLIIASACAVPFIIAMYVNKHTSGGNVTDAAIFAGVFGLLAMWMGLLIPILMGMIAQLEKLKSFEGVKEIGQLALIIAAIAGIPAIIVTAMGRFGGSGIQGGVKHILSALAIATATFALVYALAAMIPLCEQMTKANIDAGKVWTVTGALMALMAVLAVVTAVAAAFNWVGVATLGVVCGLVISVALQFFALGYIFDRVAAIIEVIVGAIEKLPHSMSLLKVALSEFIAAVKFPEGYIDNLGKFVDVLFRLSGLGLIFSFFKEPLTRFAEAMDSLKKGFSSLVPFLTEIQNLQLDKIGTGLEYLSNGLLSLITPASIIGLLSSIIIEGAVAITELANSLNEMIPVLTTINDTDYTALSDNINTITSNLFSLGTTAVIIGVFSGVIEAGGQAIIGLGNNLQTAAPIIDSALTTIGNALLRFKIILDYFSGKTVSETVSNFLQDTGTTLETESINTAESAKTAGDNVANGFIEGFSDPLDYHSPPGFVVNFMADTALAFISSAPSLLTVLTEVGSSMANALIDAFRDVTGWHSDPDFVEDFMADTETAFVNEGNRIGPSIGDVGKSIGDWFVDGFNKALAGIKQGLGNFFGDVAASAFGFENLDDAKGKLSGYAKKVKDKVKDIYDSVSNYSDFKDLAEKLGFPKVEIPEIEMPEVGGTGGAGGGGKAAVEDAFDNYELIITHFVDKYQENLAAISDTNPIELAVSALDTLETKFEEAGTSIGEVGKTIRDSIINQMDIFKEFEKKTELSADQLISNMKSQVEGVKEWSGMLQTLGERGIEQGLLQKLAELGPNGYEYVNAFVNMTEDQLQEANSLYSEALVIPESATAQILSGFAYAAQMATDGFAGFLKTDGASEAMEGGQAVANATITGVESALGIASPSRVMANEAMYTVLGFCNYIQGEGVGMVVNAMTRFSEEAIGTFEKVCNYDKSFELGANFVSGIIDGIDSMSEQIQNAVENISSMIPNTTAATLQEHSPSKLAFRQGKFWGIGLANGIKDSDYEIRMATENLARSTFDSFTTMSEDIDSAFNGYNPVIMPLLDTTTLASQAQTISSMLDANKMEADLRLSNDWSNPSVRNKFLEDMSSVMDNSDIVDAINNKDNVAQVYLEGDAAGVFKVVQQQNRKFLRRTGYSGL